MAVERIASTIAASFRGVGLVENRVSITAETLSPWGAGPVSSVNTPTNPGRRLGSGKPVYCSEPSDFVSPTNVAKVPASDEVISMLEHPGAPPAPATRALGTLATTTLRSVMSTRSLETVTNRALRAACLLSFGAVPKTMPPRGGIERITSHGTVAVIDTGVSEINGAVTLLSCPACGQFSVAVVCTTGSSGVSTDNTKPTSPAIVATQRAIFTSRVMASLMTRLRRAPVLARSSMRSSLAFVSRVTAGP